MIKLISLIGSIGLAGTAAIPIINNEINDNNDKDFVAETKYWNQNHSKEEFTAATKGNNQITDISQKKSIMTINMGSKKPSFRFIEFNGSKNGAAFRWGKTRANYNLPYMLSFDLNENNNYKFENENDPSFYRFTSIKIYYKKSEEDNSTICHSLSNFGWTWYEEDGQYYVQFLFLQFVSTSYSRTPAINSIDIGIGMTFFK